MSVTTRRRRDARARGRCRTATSASWTRPGIRPEGACARRMSLVTAPGASPVSAGSRRAAVHRLARHRLGGVAAVLVAFYPGLFPLFVGATHARLLHQRPDFPDLAALDIIGMGHRQPGIMDLDLVVGHFGRGPGGGCPVGVG